MNPKNVPRENQMCDKVMSNWLVEQNAGIPDTENPHKKDWQLLQEGVMGVKYQDMSDEDVSRLFGIASRVVLTVQEYKLNMNYEDMELLDMWFMALKGQLLFRTNRKSIKDKLTSTL